MQAPTRPEDREQRLIVALGVALVVSAILLAAGTFGWLTNEENSIGEWLTPLAIAAVVAVGVWFLNRNAVRTAGGSALAMRTLILGVLTVLSVPAFWLGLHPVFAAGAGVLGANALATADQSQRLKAYGGMALGLLGFAVGAIANLFG